MGNRRLYLSSPNVLASLRRAAMHVWQPMCYTCRMDRQAMAVRRKKLGFLLMVSGLTLSMPDVHLLKVIGGGMLLWGFGMFIAGRLNQ